MKLALFYHCLFCSGSPPSMLPSAAQIATEQMGQVRRSGLLESCSEFVAGINGGEESSLVASAILPAKTKPVMHGLACHNENRTLVELEKWLPGHADWYVLYFHCKGATHGPGPVLDQRTRWRRCMMQNLVEQWRRCVLDLDAGYESVGCHWMEPPATPPAQFIWAGNFWWAKASFLLTLPSILERARIKESGIDAAESRYESEVWIGNGPRPPRVKDYHGPGWNPSKVETCMA